MNEPQASEPTIAISSSTLSDFRRYRVVPTSSSPTSASCIKRYALVVVSVLTACSVLGGVVWQISTTDMGGGGDRTVRPPTFNNNKVKATAVVVAATTTTLPNVDSSSIGGDGSEAPLKAIASVGGASVVEERRNSGIVGPKLYVVTVQTAASPGWCKMLLSYQMTITLNGSERREERGGEADGGEDEGKHVRGVYNIGWGEAYGHAKRPGWILQWVAHMKLRDEDVVMFIDGADTVFTGANMKKSVLDRFVSGTAAKDPAGGDPSSPPSLPALLFNAEANCYHQQTFSGPWGVKKGRCLLAYEELHRRWASSSGGKNRTRTQSSRTAQKSTSLSKFRYLNAGAWIGRVWAVRKVFSEAHRQIQAGKGKYWCDQSIMGGILLSQKYDHITTMGIDMQNVFFLPTYHVRFKADICRRAEANGTDGSDEGDGIGMCHSNERPALLHFNGKSGAKVLNRQLLERTRWWNPNVGKQREQLQMALGREGSAGRGSMNLVGLSGGVVTMKTVPLVTHCSSAQYPQG